MSKIVVGDRVRIYEFAREHDEQIGKVVQIDLDDQTVFVGFEKGKPEWYHIKQVRKIKNAKSILPSISELNKIVQNEIEMLSQKHKHLDARSFSTKCDLERLMVRIGVLEHRVKMLEDINTK